MGRDVENTTIVDALSTVEMKTSAKFQSMLLDHLPNTGRMKYVNIKP